MGLHINPKAISSQQLGAAMLASALERHPDLDAVFCTNDDLALGALLRCQRDGIAVPQRIAITRFHGLDTSREMYPTMASVIAPRYAIGHTAAELLLKKLATRILPPTRSISAIRSLWGKPFKAYRPAAKPVARPVWPPRAAF